MHLAPCETGMWDQDLPEQSTKLDDAAINEKYLKRELRIVTESNREQLPNFVEALERVGWMNLRPFYQRRPRWDPKRQSKLIESFIMNIPVPPLFVYEADLAKYEVMDGQQRITAVRDFYANKFALTGLEQWPELNGRRYNKLPSEIRKGIDRRSISYIVLLKESASTTEEESLLRQQVFERLNTGGVKLSNQEIRHCIYHSDFDRLVLDLTHNSIIRDLFKMPAYSVSEDDEIPEPLLKNKPFTQMRDAELVLRFFAFRHSKRFRRGVQGFLDIYMVRAKKFNTLDLEILRHVFNATIKVASDIYGDKLFLPWNAQKSDWGKQPLFAFADAVLVAISERLEKQDKLTSGREEILKRTKNLFAESGAGAFTGMKNTKADLLDRIKKYGAMLDSIIGG